MVILKRDRGSGTAVPHLIQPNIIQQQMRFGKSQLQKSTSWECVNSQKCDIDGLFNHVAAYASPRK